MLRTTLAGLLLVIPAVATAQDQETEDELLPALAYRNGIRTRSSNGLLRLHINGRAMIRSQAPCR